jgi:hypothetical protein
MDSANDLPLEETRLWFADYAQRRFAPIPAELIAGHVLAVTVGADFPVRRAAIEALHRRMQNIDSDGLFVKQSPEKRILGQYTIAKPTNGKGAFERDTSHDLMKQYSSGWCLFAGNAIVPTFSKVVSGSANIY